MDIYTGLPLDSPKSHFVFIIGCFGSIIVYCITIKSMFCILQTLRLSNIFKSTCSTRIDTSVIKLPSVTAMLYEPESFLATTLLCRHSSMSAPALFLFLKLYKDDSTDKTTCSNFQHFCFELWLCRVCGENVVGL